MVYKNEQIKNCQTLEELFNLWKSKPITVQSYYDKDKKENVEVTIDHSTMRFNSIPFTRGIFELNGMNRDKTYQIEGIYIEDRNVAVFNMSDAIVCNRVACV